MPNLVTENVVARVRQEVDKFFTEKSPDHKPSEKMRLALDDIPRTICKILKGEADPKYYVCDLDTGVGKSVTLSQTIKLLGRPMGPLFGEDPGILMCVPRLDMIETLVEDMRLESNQFAVFVSDRPARRMRRHTAYPSRSPVSSMASARMSASIGASAPWCFTRTLAER